MVLQLLYPSLDVVLVDRFAGRALDGALDLSHAVGEVEHLHPGFLEPDDGRLLLAGSLYAYPLDVVPDALVGHGVGDKAEQGAHLDTPAVREDAPLLDLIDLHAPA